MVCVERSSFPSSFRQDACSTGTATRRLVSSTGSSTRTVRAGDRKLRQLPRSICPHRRRRPRPRRGPRPSVSTDVVSEELGDWTIDGGGGYWINQGGADKNFWFSGVLLQRKVTDKLTVGGEIFHQTADSIESHDSTGFNVERSTTSTNSTTFCSQPMEDSKMPRTPMSSPGTWDTYLRVPNETARLRAAPARDAAAVCPLWVISGHW